MAVAIPGFPHVQQHLSWDCGLACVEAVASWRGSAPLPALVPLFPDCSVWTIDLALLLVEQAAVPPSDLRFSTTCAGVNSAHAGKAFYTRLVDDTPRVTAQFDRAVAAGLSIAVETLDANVIRRNLSSLSSVFVCLLDLRWIACQACGTLHKALQFSFAGHYVVLHGYRSDDDVLLFMDPAAPCAACCMPFAAFERARSSDGTDADVIEVAVAAPLREAGTIT